jgi:hypothetical protein
MILTVDSNVLLSIFSADSLYQDACSLLIKYKDHDYVINDVIYLEIGVFFNDLSILDSYLKLLDIERLKNVELDPQRIISAWRTYLKQKQFVCPQCQKTIAPECPSCHTPLSFRQKVLPDFMIADFVMACSDGMMTFDPKYYRNYFPAIRIFN